VRYRVLNGDAMPARARHWMKLRIVLRVVGPSLLSVGGRSLRSEPHDAGYCS